MDTSELREQRRPALSDARYSVGYAHAYREAVDTLLIRLRQSLDGTPILKEIQAFAERQLQEVHEITDRAELVVGYVPSPWVNDEPDWAAIFDGDATGEEWVVVRKPRLNE